MVSQPFKAGTPPIGRTSRVELVIVEMRVNEKEIDPQPFPLRARGEWKVFFQLDQQRGKLFSTNWGASPLRKLQLALFQRATFLARPLQRS